MPHNSRRIAPAPIDRAKVQELVYHHEAEPKAMNQTSPRIADLEALALAQPERHALSRPDGRGRAEALLLVVDRDLSLEDLKALASAPKEAKGHQPSVKAIRHTHHLLARAIAEGASDEEASLLTGYDPCRINSIRTAPAFAELVAYYATQETAKDLDLRKRLESFGLSSLDILQERMEEDPDRFSNRELKELAELGLSQASPSGPVGKGVVLASGTAPISISVSFVTPSAAANGGSGPSGKPGDSAVLVGEHTVLDVEAEP